MASEHRGVAFTAMRHHYIRSGFLNELLASKAIRQILWADLSKDKEFLDTAARMGIGLDELARLLGLAHRRDLVENVGGSFRVKTPVDLGTLSTQLKLASMVQQLMAYGQRWDSARDRITQPGGEVHDGISSWVLKTAPTMPWLVDELVEAFRRSWMNIILNFDAAVIMDREVVIPPPTLITPIEIQLRFDPGAVVSTVEERLNAEIAVARATIVEAKRAWGPLPAKTSDTLEMWGRWACRVIVFQASIRSIALEHFRAVEYPETRIKDVRDGVKKARESLDTEVPPGVRVLTSFG